MDIESIRNIGIGEAFYNQIQILERLIVEIIRNFAEIESVEIGDELSKLEIKIEEKIFCFFISYFKNAVIIDSNGSLSLVICNYIRPFMKKVYRINEKNSFVELLHVGSLRNLYFSVRHEFLHQSFVFEKFPRVIFAEILSFLDKKSLVKVLGLCKDIKEAVDNKLMWRDLYYSRFGNCDFRLANMDWKSIYLRERKDNILKSVGLGGIYSKK